MAGSSSDSQQIPHFAVRVPDKTETTRPETSIRESFTLYGLLCKRKPTPITMSFETDLPSFAPSIDTDELRPALLVAGTQLMISLAGAILVTSGALA